MEINFKFGVGLAHGGLIAGGHRRGISDGDHLDGKIVGHAQMIDIKAALGVPIIVVDAGYEGEFFLIQRIDLRKNFFNDSIEAGAFQRLIKRRRHRVGAASSVGRCR